MNLLITGTDGYIGSILAPVLMRSGHTVTGLDTGFYRSGWLFNNDQLSPVLPATINKDLRHVTKEDLAGIDTVIHLAELSNDPLGQNNPEVTFKINHQGSVHLAEQAKKAGVSRFVYTSSCSVYGAATSPLVDEKSEVNPQTAYAECKIRVERDLKSMANKDFCPVILRNATAYGASPRMRFDIVLNNLSGLAWVTRKIAMTSDGSPWRPLVHVLDICRAIECAVEAPQESVYKEVFNVGSDAQNYQVKEIATIVGEIFPGCKVTFGSSDGDNRSYKVSFDKIATQLPGFKCEWDAEKGAQQLYDIFKTMSMGVSEFEANPFTRLKQLKYLIESNQVDSDLFWMQPN